MIANRILLCCSLVVTLAACDRKAQDPQTDHAAASTPVAKAAASAPPLRNAAGKLTKEGFDAAWSSIYRGAHAAYEPADKKLSAFEAKVGKPASESDGTLVWWVFDGDQCYRADMTKDGTTGMALVGADKCEK